VVGQLDRRGRRRRRRFLADRHFMNWTQVLEEVLHGRAAGDVRPSMALRG